jgi:hypothetical protein
MADPDRRPIERIAGFGLEALSPTGVIALADGDAPPFLSDVSRQRLTGIAFAAAEDGTLRIPPEGQQMLLASHRAAMLHALTLERHLLSVIARLESKGIGSVVLKGTAVAHAFYPDPAWRPFGDIDLMVSADDWDGTCAALGKEGYRRRFPEPRPGFARRFGKTAAFVGSDGTEVDLHRTVAAGAFGFWIDPDELLRRTATFRIGGRTLARLDDTAAFIHACVHAALGSRPPLLLPLRDVGQLSTTGAIDWDAAADLAVRWRLRAVIRYAVQTAVARLGIRLPNPALALANDARPTRREMEALEAFTTERRHRAGRAISGLRAIPGPRAKASYLLALTIPTREFLGARSPEARTSYVRRWRKPFARRTEGTTST